MKIRNRVLVDTNPIIERSAPQPVATQVFHASGERQRSRLDRRRGGVPQTPTAKVHFGVRHSTSNHIISTSLLIYLLSRPLSLSLSLFYHSLYYITTHASTFDSLWRLWRAPQFHSVHRFYILIITLNTLHFINLFSPSLECFIVFITFNLLSLSLSLSLFRILFRQFKKKNTMKAVRLDESDGHLFVFQKLCVSPFCIAGL